MQEPITQGTIVMYEGSEYRFISYWDRETVIIEDFYTRIPKSAPIDLVLPIPSFTEIV